MRIMPTSLAVQGYSLERSYLKQQSLTDMLTSSDSLRDLVLRYGTPLYLLDVQKILDSMKGLQNGVALHYPNIEVTYSVKTNYLSHILRQVLSAGFRLEVVSRHEMALAEKNGAKPSQLLFNGPVKTFDDLTYCYENSIDVNLDSVEELEIASSIGTRERPFRLGLRVAAVLKNGKVSRFGIHFEDSAVLEQIRKRLQSQCVEIVGFHIHHSSRRDAQSYCDRLDQLQQVADILGVKPTYLDIGGGVGSIPPPEIVSQLSYQVDDPTELAITIGKYALDKFGLNGPRIIMEPGIGVLAPSMNYITRIVSVKNRGTVDVAVCDGSLFDVNPLRSTIPPPCHLVQNHASRGEADSDTCCGEPTRLYGGTCMEIDQIGVLPAGPAPIAGDLVVVTNVGAYSACLAPHFIVPAVPIFAVESNRIIRERAAPGNFLGAGL